MRIKVKQEHIDSGRKCHGWGCPVALALNEQTGDGPWFCGGELELGTPGSLLNRLTGAQVLMPENEQPPADYEIGAGPPRWKEPLPESVRQFIIAFDRLWFSPPKPFGFDLSWSPDSMEGS